MNIEDCIHHYCLNNKLETGNIYKNKKKSQYSFLSRRNTFLHHISNSHSTYHPHTHHPVHADDHHPLLCEHKDFCEELRACLAYLRTEHSKFSPAAIPRHWQS